MPRSVLLPVTFNVTGFGVVCGACGDRRTVKADGTGEPVRAWAAAHHQPWLIALHASVNGEPTIAHPLLRPRLLR